MAKVKRTYVCSTCGSSQPRWMGKCPACNSWDTLEEVKLDADLHAPISKSLEDTSFIEGVGLEIGVAPTAVPIAEARTSGVESLRIPTTLEEFDRVLGGGIVPGSVVLLGGDPGIGKSTLLLQSSAQLARTGVRTLYVTSEESAEQVRSRAERLRPADQSEHPDDLYVLADTNIARILEQIARVKPEVVAIDSIQMVYKPDLDASPGSVAQLRRCTLELTHLAKQTGIAVVLVGHVTKEGNLAGPKLLEHLVDAVLSFEGDRFHAHRLVRAIKNRFGSTLEIGVFEMTAMGLQQLPEGSSADANQEPRAGSVVCPLHTGSRTMLVEMQALTAVGFPGSVKRRASGVDANRLAMIIAVLEQHAELRLHDMDVFASAASGIRVNEPAADLALALAIAGSHLRRTLPSKTAALGEIGLGGELRPVPHLHQRLQEAARLGYDSIIIPGDRRNTSTRKGNESLPKGVTLVEARTIAGVIDSLT
ncbi:MAG: DNA repair protein RadA [Planctomycetota bacterium]